MNNPDIENMIKLISRLPGLGPRSGRRVALHLLKKKDVLLAPLINALSNVASKILNCTTCYNIDTTNPCYICDNDSRDSKSICVVAEISDLWAIERSMIFNGKYHILGGVLSAIDNIGPDKLNIDKLLQRIKSKNITEIVMALNATLDGQTTVHYLCNLLKCENVKIYSLAHGVPIGGELDYLDDGTLIAAFNEKKAL